MCDRKRRSFEIMVLLAVFTLACVGETQAQDVSVKELFAAQAEQFRRLHSLDMTVTRTHILPPGKDSGKPYPYVYRFQLEGEKFRTEAGLQWSQLPVGMTANVYTFDGEEYQVFHKSRLDLNVRDQPIMDGHKYSVNPLVLRPFFFALQGNDVTFEAAWDGETWTSLARRAQVCGVTTIDGHECIQVDIPTGREGERVPVLERVYLARDLEFYPLRTEQLGENGNVLSRVTVGEPLKVDTAQGAIVIPLAMTNAGYNSDGAIRSTYEYSVDRASLSVNEDIPDGVFQVPVAHASSYSEGMDRSNSFYLDALTMNRPPLAHASLGNSLWKETGVWVQPASVYFAAVDSGVLPESRTIEIMPDRTRLKRKLETAYHGDRGWLTEELKNTEPLPEGTLERIEVESTSSHVVLRTEHSPESVKVHVTLDKNAPLGLVRENLLIRLNDPAGHTIRIPVVAEVRGRYQAAPAGFFFGNPAFGEQVKRSCCIGPLGAGDRVEIVIPRVASGGWLNMAVRRVTDAAVLDVCYRHTPPQDEVTDVVTLRIRSEGGNKECLVQVPLLSEWDSRVVMSHVMVGDTAPNFAYRTLAGVKGELSDLRGKVVLVNLFATWCGPCRTELPRLEEDIVSRFDPDKFALICVGIGHGIGELKAFRTEHNLTLPMAEDPDRKIHDAFVEKTGIPRNYVIDHTGRIVYQASGYSEARFARLVDVLAASVARVPAKSNVK